MPIIVLLSAAALTLQAQNKAEEYTDTLPHVKGDTLREVIITKDSRLPVFVSSEAKDVPRQKSISDIIGRRATDMIMHPFAFSQRKEERRRKKILKKLKEYDLIKTDEELIRAALLREGIDADSLLQMRDSIMHK
ncbi:MAG: hypothetical protein IJ064_02535 [Bacteroidaceae bacterium]|nr:hypothetical protein [Bacteroidaceae bacterium]